MAKFYYRKKHGVDLNTLCVICGKKFERRTTAKTCSGICRKQHYRNLDAKFMSRKRENNPEYNKVEKGYHDAYYKNHHAEILEKAKVSGKEWRSNPENKIKQKELSAKWYQENKEKCRIQARIYAKSHPEYAKLNKMRRRSVERNLIQFPKAHEINERLNLFGGCCYCGRKEALTLEHVVAISQGGNNNPENLLGACKRCNSSKQHREWKEWFRVQTFYDRMVEQKIEQFLRVEIKSEEKQNAEK